MNHKVTKKRKNRNGNIKNKVTLKKETRNPNNKFLKKGKSQKKGGSLLNFFRRGLATITPRATVKRGLFSKFRNKGSLTNPSYSRSIKSTKGFRSKWFGTKTLQQKQNILGSRYGQLTQKQTLYNAQLQKNKNILAELQKFSPNSRARRNLEKKITERNIALHDRMGKIQGELGKANSKLAEKHLRSRMGRFRSVTSKNIARARRRGKLTPEDLNFIQKNVKNEKFRTKLGNYDTNKRYHELRRKYGSRGFFDHRKTFNMSSLKRLKELKPDQRAEVLAVLRKRADMKRGKSTFSKHGLLDSQLKKYDTYVLNKQFRRSRKGLPDDTPLITSRQAQAIEPKQPILPPPYSAQPPPYSAQPPPYSAQPPPYSAQPPPVVSKRLTNLSIERKV